MRKIKQQNTIYTFFQIIHKISEYLELSLLSKCPSVYKIQQYEIF